MQRKKCDRARTAKKRASETQSLWDVNNAECRQAYKPCTKQKYIVEVIL